MINEFDKLCNKIMTEKKNKSGKEQGVDGKACWKGYKRQGTKKKGGKTVDNCVKIKENIRRMTGAPHANRIKIGDDMKQQLLNHGMKMAQRGGGDLRTIIMTLGALVSRNDKFSDNAKQALHEYLGGDYGRELEAKLDAYDQEMFGENNVDEDGREYIYRAPRRGHSSEEEMIQILKRLPQGMGELFKPDREGSFLVLTPTDKFKSYSVTSDGMGEVEEHNLGYAIVGLVDGNFLEYIKYPPMEKEDPDDDLFRQTVNDYKRSEGL